MSAPSHALLLARCLFRIRYYLPQLCHLIVAYPSETKALARYLMDLSSRSIHFALRIGWLFNAIATPLPTSSKTAMEVNERYFDTLITGLGIFLKW